MKRCTHKTPEEINFEDYVNKESLYYLALSFRDAIYRQCDLHKDERFLLPGLREALRMLIDTEYKDKKLDRKELPDLDIMIKNYLTYNM